MKQLLPIFFALFSFFVNAATIDTLSVYSNKMNKEIKTIVISPSNAKSQNMPVVYLLHGHGGDETSWMYIRNFDELSDLYSIIFVCPDGENSWYWDSPTNSNSQFETFISKELPAFIDTHYNTNPAREARAIAGLSMGGHGALWNALRHKDVFGAAGSLSGGVDIRPFPENWNMKDQLGDYQQNKTVWDNHTVINQLGSLKNNELAIIIDCGKDDFFFEVNDNLHNKLDSLNINHDYIVRPGQHNVPYWRNSIDFQILFFHKYFESIKVNK